MKSLYDVIVVGGGPTGATAARIAALNGAKVLLVDENYNPKKAKQCAGLISLRALKEADASWDSVQRKISGAHVYTPDGGRLSFNSDGIKAVVIDRSKFDQELLSKAEQAGVHIRSGSRAVGLECNKITLQEDGEEKIVEAKVIIGADGPRSKIAKWAGLPAPQKLLPAIQAVVPYNPECADFVEVFFGKKIAPGFFAWAVPASNGQARVGLASDHKGSLKPLFSRFIDNRFSKEIIEIGTGVIPIGPAARTVTDHVLLVGDAAGQVKPTSGGGIYTGMLCARIAGEVAARCALSSETSANALMEYETRWRSLLQKELFFGLQVHRLLCRISDDDLNKIFTLFDSPKILEIINQYGDTDYPSILARELFKFPKLWGKLLSVIPAKELFLGMLQILS